MEAIEAEQVSSGAQSGAGAFELPSNLSSVVTERFDGAVGAIDSVGKDILMGDVAC